MKGKSSNDPCPSLAKVNLIQGKNSVRIRMFTGRHDWYTPFSVLALDTVSVPPETRRGTIALYSSKKNGLYL